MKNLKIIIIVAVVIVASVFSFINTKKMVIKKTNEVISNSIENVFEQLENEFMSYHENLKTCTPGSYPNSDIKIKGQSGNYCFVEKYTTIEDKKYPYKNCKMKMSEVSNYAQERINEYRKNGISQKLLVDKMNDDCSMIPNTFKEGNMTITIDNDGIHTLKVENGITMRTTSSY